MYQTSIHGLPYVRVTFKGVTGRKRTCWAIKTKPGRYTVLDDHGEKWKGSGSTLEIVIADPTDIIREVPARLNLHYEEMEEMPR